MSNVMDDPKWEEPEEYQVSTDHPFWELLEGFERNDQAMAEMAALMGL